MGNPHNRERYGETWPQHKIDASLVELEEIRDWITISGGWAWHFMSPQGHVELKHAHDHKDIDVFVEPENVALVALSATLPGTGVREGDHLDVHVSAVGPAESLDGGRLFLIPMTGPLPGSPVYAFAEGAVSLVKRIVVEGPMALWEMIKEKAAELIRARDGNVAYSLAKRGIALKVREYAGRWGAAGVRLNALAPGKIETPMLDRIRADPMLGEAVRAMPVPLERSAPPEEMASVIAFLLGPDARYVHGAVIHADGGADAVARPAAL